MVIRTGALLLMTVLAACGSHPTPVTATRADDEGDEVAAPPSTPPPTPHASVRLIHAAVGASDQAVSLAADGESTAAIGYQFSSEYLSLTPDDHEVSARANDADLISASFTFALGMATLVAYTNGDFPVALALMNDPATEPPSGMAQIRVFHAIVGQGPIDLCTPATTARGDGAPVVPNVLAGSANGADGTYVTVTAGTELILQVRAQNAVPCHGRVLGTAHGFSPVSGSNYTLVFVGRTAGRQRVAPELLFCADPPALDTSCATLALDAH